MRWVAVATAVAFAFVLPFLSLLVPIAGQSSFQAWTVVCWLLAIPGAGLFYGYNVDRRAEFAERALENGKLEQAFYARTIEHHHSAKRQLLVLSSISAGIPAGLFMSLIFPETELIKLNAALGQSTLEINSKNAGFAVMALSFLGLCIVGLAGAVTTPIKSFVNSFARARS